MEYALTQPQGLESLIVADSPASMRQWVAEANRPARRTAAEVQETLLRPRLRGRPMTRIPGAILVYYDRHLCRLATPPDCVARTFEKLRAIPRSRRHDGPSEFHVTGVIGTGHQLQARRNTRPDAHSSGPVRRGYARDRR
jgi:L-proline amide hydrolase